jgi:hypothetical protein
LYWYNLHCSLVQLKGKKLKKRKYDSYSGCLIVIVTPFPHIDLIDPWPASHQWLFFLTVAADSFCFRISRFLL